MKEVTFRALPPRIKSKLVKYGKCWLWCGAESGNGYGKVSIDGRMKMAHRAIYEILVGPVPEGLVLDHLCRNRRCCNPGHMEPVTAQETTRRGEARLFQVAK